MRRRLQGVLLALALTGCSDNQEYAQSIAVLVDVSGTYADQKPEVVDTIKRGILPGMVPGDHLMLIRIDAESYEEGNVEAAMTLDARPSHANAQKLAFARELDDFATRPDEAVHTDIRGAMMLAADYLRETGAGTQTIVAFSDMKEELPAGVSRSFESTEFADIRVAAVKVKKLRGDNADPDGYRDRLAAWESTLRDSGAREWRVIVDSGRLAEYVESR